MSNTGGTERAELYRTIWRIANELRGSVDGWDFKTYVLGMLFYRFISENLSRYLNEQERLAGHPDFDYAALGDEDAEFGREKTVREKGFYILPSQLFSNIRKVAGKDANLNETLAAVFAAIEGSAMPASRSMTCADPSSGGTLHMESSPAIFPNGRGSLGDLLNGAKLHT